MRKILTTHGDLLLGVAVVAMMSAAYLRSGEFTLDVRSSASATEIVPVVNCVARDPVNAGSYVAMFGYERTGGSAVVRVPYASIGAALNYVNVGGNPLPPNYGVPTEFLIGSQRNQFAVRALDTQSATWWLTSDQTRSVVANSRTQPVCTVPPSTTGASDALQR